MQKKAFFLGLFVLLLGNQGFAQTGPLKVLAPPVIVHEPQEEMPIPERAPEVFQKAQLADISQNDAIKTVILAQLDAFRNQDYSKAYYAYTSLDFQNTVPLETFKIFVRKSPALYKNQSFILQNVTFSGVLAIVKGTLKTNNNIDVQAEYQFIQENGNWKIRKLELLGVSKQAEKE